MSVLLKDAVRNPDVEDALRKVGYAIAEAYNILRLKVDFNVKQSLSIINEVVKIAIRDEEEE